MSSRLAVGDRVECAGEAAAFGVGTVTETDGERVLVCWTDRQVSPQIKSSGATSFSAWFVPALVRRAEPSSGPTLPEILAAYETMRGESVLTIREGLPRVALGWTAQVGTGDMCRPWSVEDRPRLVGGRVDPRPTSDNNVAARVFMLAGDDDPGDGKPYEAWIDHDQWEATRHATQAEAMFACDEGLRAARVALCGPYLISKSELILTKRGRAKLDAALAAEGKVSP